jgi:hypothetical protein
MEEYCVFKVSDGGLVFTSSTEPTHYIDNDEYIVIKSKIIDYDYSYSYIDGKIIKGDKHPEITE